MSNHRPYRDHARAGHRRSTPDGRAHCADAAFQHGGKGAAKSGGDCLCSPATISCFPRTNGGLQPALNAQLSKNHRNVVANGLLADDEFLRDAMVIETLSEQIPELPVREA